jgi:transglutaminase-like putative cysteine protease
LPHEGPDGTALRQVAARLRLGELRPEQVRSAVAGFFRRDFSYSTWLPDAPRTGTNTTSLAAFLLETRAGHCEYFATATVLLLRQAGVPARYATGYAVQERSGSGYVVRQRHAHAWCLAWINGAWHDFDTTPSDWAEREQVLASMWQPFRDFWSRLWFEFSKWRFSRSGLRPYFLALLVPPLGLLVFRVFFRKQWNRFRRTRRDRDGAAPWPGSDSEFYLVEGRLARQGHARGPAESAADWLARIEKTVPEEGPALRALLGLHNRLRFDPAGLPAGERADLREQARRWLDAKN